MAMEVPFRDRSEAGRVLAEYLATFRGRPDVVVLGLPRGGVPVAAEVARSLDAELDILLVRKLGLPGQEELAMGAIASGGVRIENEEVVRAAGVSPGDVARVEARELAELRRRERAFRGERPPVLLDGRCVILVDDGLATGSTMRAAVEAVRRRGAARVVVAVPVAPPRALETLCREADEVVCAVSREPFLSVGRFYSDFSQLEDAGVRTLLEEAWGASRERVSQATDGGAVQAAGPEAEAGGTGEVVVHAAGAALRGRLTIPDGARAVVVFAHRSGGGRDGPRDRFVARALEEAGFATLLFDLLTPAEERADDATRQFRFDIGLLAGRLTGTVDWVRARPATRRLPVGLFGTSTGAAAALVTAAWRPKVVGAVVSRGGRPDLADEALGRVRAPTLLIVGELDEAGFGLNRLASSRMHVERRLEPVPGAGHWFDEPDALETVARLARDWFRDHLAPVD